MAARLSESAVRKALAPASGTRILWDDSVKGLGVRITAAGARAFVLDYRCSGRQRRITIGSFPDWTVSAARDAAKRLKRDIDLGGDPMAKRHADRVAPTIEDLWERYRREHLPTKAPHAQRDEAGMWRRLVLPQLGKTRVAAIEPQDIDTLHRQITQRGTPVRANRTVESVRKALNLAVRWGWRADNPAQGVRRNAEEPRHRYLSAAEASALAQALLAHPQRASADALLFLMLTGARRGEVLGATWDEFDLDLGIWTKPSAHTKQRRIHRVPLGRFALDLLRRRRDGAVSGYVFPGESGAPLQEIRRVWHKACETAGIQDFRIHDLRHNFASLLVSSGASLPAIGQLLGHTQPGTTARYAHLYDEPLRVMVQQVDALVTAAPLHLPARVGRLEGDPDG